jgi:hypothetical protein
MTHFTDIELHRWSQSGPGPDRERIVAHLAACADCARRHAAAIRNRPLQAEPAADAQEFAAAGRRVPKRGRWVAPLAAAAVLVIAVAIPIAMRRENTANELHLRGGAIVTSTSGSDLVWSSGISAPRYRIEIADASGTIFSSLTDRTRMPRPPQLKPGVQYWWTVTALDAQGRPIMASPRRTLIISR